MPASDISRVSTMGHHKSDMAAAIAKDIAHREIRLRIGRNQLNQNDEQSIRREWKDIYKQEYYKYYAMLIQQDQRPEKIIYLPTENPSATKFYSKHCVAGFNKTNLFVHVRKSDIIVGRINYPLDDNDSLETKEAILGAWPGPLDRHDDLLKRKTTDYIDTLYQHDSQRRIKYFINDDQRKVILKLLTELLHRNGAIDAPGITRLLLRPEQTEIQKDEGNRRPLDTLQKYLLLGKRSEAIKYARAKRLWDHAQCLAFLDKYQPPATANYHKDALRLRDDSIVQLNNEYIDSIQAGILNTVYRSLLNRILQSDPESLNIVKHTDVGSDIYNFAMLSANDCDMEFDQSNEVFKLIMAIKRANNYAGNETNSHIVSLGLTTTESPDPSDELSYMSQLSFRQTETPASRTLNISNIDMLIINEIWEYCFNLARGTADPVNYEYIVNLIPYKLIFASKLLDYGLHGMFDYYLYSIKNALAKAKSERNLHDRDQYYDWETINRSVENISQIWDVLRASFEPQSLQDMTNPLYTSIASPAAGIQEPQQAPLLMPVQQMPAQQNIPAGGYNTSPAPTSVPAPAAGLNYSQPNSFQPPQVSQAPMQQYNNMVYQPPPFGIPPGFSNQQPPIPEETNDYNPDPEMQDNTYNDYSNPDYSNEPSRRTSMDAPPFQPAPPPPLMERKQMASSSPVNRSRSSFEPQMADSFNAFSPINEYEDGPPLQFRSNANNSSNQPRDPPSSSAANSNSQTRAAGNPQSNPTGNTASNPSNNQQDGESDAQQSSSGIFASLTGSVQRLLPKSNSKQMILPDDSSKTIVYDEERKTWIDTTKGDFDQQDDFSAPPPMMPPTGPPPSYSLGLKSTKNRYPRT